MSIKTLSTLAFVTSLAFSPAFAASEGEAQDIKPVDQVGGVRLGQLNCNVEGGWGLLLGSSKKASCEYVKVDGTTETYEGKLNKLGIDIGKTKDAYMTWAVFTQEDVAPAEHALTGSYTGVSGEVSLGIGLGANALIGGAGTKIGLQPIAIQENAGLNLAVGLASLTLDAAN